MRRRIEHTIRMIFEEDLGDIYEIILDELILGEEEMLREWKKEPSTDPEETIIDWIKKARLTFFQEGKRWYEGDPGKRNFIVQFCRNTPALLCKEHFKEIRRNFMERGKDEIDYDWKTAARASNGSESGPAAKAAH